jgi:hypothetical protein
MQPDMYDDWIGTADNRYEVVKVQKIYIKPEKEILKLHFSGGTN